LTSTTLPLYLARVASGAIEIFEGDFCSGLADGLGDGLIGVLDRRCGFDACGLVRKIRGDDKHDHSGDNQGSFFFIVVSPNKLAALL